MPLPSTVYAISDLYIINILHSVSQARIVKVYSFDTSTCYTYYESVRRCPPNPYHSIHCMRSIDHIIRYSVAYLCDQRAVDTLLCPVWQSGFSGLPGTD
ncbi:hypothetical protein L208DRAFT_1288203 [Tricholoma matsutake]|nr:hypothetical protein L208DRAFT_1288203 [Tricholoma matsutake 945]